jgi:hypothetical protein
LRVDGFLQAARKSVGMMQSVKMPGLGPDIPKRSLDVTEKNMKAVFDHARKLVHAKDIQEVVSLQTEFLKSQFAAAREQMKQFGSEVSDADEVTKLSDKSKDDISGT